MHVQEYPKTDQDSPLRELLASAREMGFQVESSGYCTAHDGENAVLLPTNLEALERLEDFVELHHVESRMHHYIIRPGLL